jgi:hypothetical protein
MIKAIKSENNSRNGFAFPAGCEDELIRPIRVRVSIPFFNQVEDRSALMLFGAPFIRWYAFHAFSE